MAEYHGDIGIKVAGKTVVDNAIVGVIVRGLTSTLDKLTNNELVKICHTIGASDYATITDVTSGFDYTFDLIFD